MAAIDKTYVSSWEEYKEIRDWAIKTNVIYPNGIVGDKMINWFYFPNLKEDHFKECKEYVLWNTSESVDMFLYKHCPFKLVQERLKEQYDDVSYLNRESINEHEIGNHFTLPRWYFRDVWYYVELIYNDAEWSYSNEYDTWISPNEFGPHGGSCHICISSDKALVRKIRKWNLPKGAILKFSCIRYFHDFIIRIRK